MTINYKKTISFILILSIAVFTGLSVGKIYVSTLEPSSVVTSNEEDLRDKESVVLELFERSKKEKVSNFTGLQLFQIAEYKLNHAEEFYKKMTGVVNAPMGIKQDMKGEKLKKNGKLVYNKLSPSSVSMSPSICSRVEYDYATGNIRVNPKGTFASTDAQNLKGNFKEEDFQNWSLEQYKETFNTQPTTVLSYIVSSITCGQKLITSVTDNGDGTHSFQISMSGDFLTLAALYYSYEIKFSSGLPKVPKWVSLKMNVTVDSDFNFKTIEYEETYKMFVSDVLGYWAVTDNFVDNFYFVDVPDFEEVF